MLGIYYYVEGEFLNDKPSPPKMVAVYWGPFESEQDANSYAYKALAPKPNSRWSIVTSTHADRDESKREWVSGKIMVGGDIAMVTERYGRKMQH